MQTLLTVTSLKITNLKIKCILSSCSINGGALIKAFQIKTDDSSDIDWSQVEELEMMVANTLLDWMEDDGGFGDLQY